MRVLVINGTYRPNQTTSTLSRRALEGAASVGAETEMILLTDHDIKFCTNCLTCYNDVGSDIPRCVVDDDMRSILERAAAADGIILASPVHSGFVTGVMTTFMERATWTLCRPTGEILGLKGAPEPRLTDKPRATASIVSAGMIPTELRQYCDMGTPWLKEMAPLLFNGEFIGDMYAGASYPKELSDEEWPKAAFHRELSEHQLQQAYDLGVAMATALKQEAVRPYDPLRDIAASDQM